MLYKWLSQDNCIRNPGNGFGLVIRNCAMDEITVGSSGKFKVNHSKGEVESNL